jgi:drug/metabolite transporter (DMT)-like permease
MPDRETAPVSGRDRNSLLYGLLGITLFSITLPSTRLAVAHLSPTFVGLGRAVVAAVLALLLLLITRQSIPPRRTWPQFALVVAGVIIGFPLLSAIAMRDAPASYGAVITGLLPLVTALGGVWRAGERPSRSFWLWAAIGSGLVLGFALLSGSGSLRLTDLALLGAVAAAGLGYAEGGVLARRFGAWQVICWSLVLAAPLVGPIAWLARPMDVSLVPLTAWLGFGYVSVFSMFLGFFAWYHALSLGGIARIGQLQLLQPFLTILASTLILGEPLTAVTLGFAAAVVSCVALGRRATIVTSIATDPGTTPHPPLKN